MLPSGISFSSCERTLMPMGSLRYMMRSSRPRSSNMITVSSVASAQENGIKALIRRQPLFSMYVILLTLGWAGLVEQILTSQGVLHLPSAVAFVIDMLTGWVPGIAAIVVTAVVAGRQGVRDLLR